MLFFCGVDIQSIDSDQRCVEEIRMNHGLVFVSILSATRIESGNRYARARMSQIKRNTHVA